MNTRLSYIVAHEAWWWSVPRRPDRAIVAEIHVRKDALTDQGEYDGCHWEFMLEWHNLSGKLALRVGIFDDAFEAFTTIPKFFKALEAFPKPVTPTAVTAILDTLGFSDQTERRQTKADPDLNATTLRWALATFQKEGFEGDTNAVSLIESAAQELLRRLES